MSATLTHWTVADLVGLSRPDRLAAWNSLSAPDLAEVAGEYAGDFLDGGDRKVRRQLDETILNEASEWGCWAGKAFKASGDGRGEGYNILRRSGGRVERLIRFGTKIAASALDGRPAMMIIYPAFDNANAALNSVCEFRKAGEGLYLGWGTIRDEDGTRVERFPGWFTLAGPVRTWVGVDDENAEARRDF